MVTTVRATCRLVFFFNDTATTEIYTLSLHDALPIWGVAIRFLNREPWNHQFLNMEQLEMGVAIQFLNREPLEPPFSKYGTVETEGCLYERF